jgi:hypothetical protein
MRSSLLWAIIGIITNWKTGTSATSSYIQSTRLVLIKF